MKNPVLKKVEPEKEKVHTESTLTDLLRRRFPPPEFVCLPQVRNGTGFSGRVRTADALVMGMYPSRGLELYGIEIKVARGDWLKELRNPDKSVDIQKYCDRWYVLTPAKLIQPGELPPNWGWIIPFRDSLKITKEAPKLEAEPISRKFLAAILRRAQEDLTDDRKLREEHAKGYNAGVAKTLENLKNRSSQLPYEVSQKILNYDNLKNSVLEFERASGILIQQWDGRNIGEAVSKVLQMDNYEKRLIRHMKEQKDFVNSYAQMLSNSLTQLESMKNDQH